jgi:hypothetical protein
MLMVENGRRAPPPHEQLDFYVCGAWGTIMSDLALQSALIVDTYNSRYIVRNPLP